MDYIIVCGTALFASGLTLISGFGLGTLLLPAFALFFPVNTAVAATAVVHLANNLFKMLLVGKFAVKEIVIKFGIPAATLSFAGAYLLNKLSSNTLFYNYDLFGINMTITPVKIVIGSMIFIFGLFELLPKLKKMGFDKKYISLGGALSGFAGGISGHQGALRAAFLIKAGLNKENFIGTSALCAILVDVARLTVYGSGFYGEHFETINAGGGIKLIGVAAMFAFVGAFGGSKLMKKITLNAVRTIIGILLLMISILLISGYM